MGARDIILCVVCLGLGLFFVCVFHTKKTAVCCVFIGARGILCVCVCVCEHTRTRR